MGLPRPDLVSLSQAVTFVMDRCNCSEGEAKDALRQAGLDGHLEAEGTITLSSHPNPEIRDRHPATTRDALTSATWDHQIDWIAGKIGRYSSVRIKRQSIEAWLARGREAPPATSTEALKRANDAMIDQTITAEYDGAANAGRKPPNVKEIIPLVQEALRSKGYQASGLQIQKLADAPKHKNRRRKPGKTVASEKRRQQK